MKKYILILAAVLTFSGCVSAYRPYFAAPEPLTEKDRINAEKMSQILGIKHETTLLLDRDELSFALQHREYFAEAVKMLGFSAVALPFASASDADIESEEGKAMQDLVLFLESQSLKCVYLLRESFFINRHQGSRFIWRGGNPYRDTLLKLKEFRKSLVQSAEMSTVIIAIEMNHWNDSNADCPAGLLFTWRKDKKYRGSSNDRMFMKSMEFFDSCREILDLEQLILVADEEVVNAGEKGYLTGGNVAQLLEKCDALGVVIDRKDNKSPGSGRLQFMKLVAENGAVFVIVPSDWRHADTYNAWLDVLKKWHIEADKFDSNAGVWIQNWQKLNKVWRNAQ